MHLEEPMSDWRHERRTRYDDVTIPAVWIAIVLSLLVHGVAMWTWLPQMRRLSLEDGDPGQASGALVAQLTPRANPPEPSPPAPPPEPPRRTPPLPQRRPPSPVAPPAPSPPVIAANQAAPESAAPTPVPSAAPPPPARSATETDLSAFIEARRRARGVPSPAPGQGDASNAPAAESDIERRNRIVAANVASNPNPTFGYDPKSGGGIFQIQRLDTNDATFVFNGWNKDIGRNTKQLIEVRRGSNSDIRIAVARRIIEIIRDHESGDFVFISRRLGHGITLSARPGDNAELEDFVMREFFPGARPPY
jgi:hypothetical protein